MANNTVLETRVDSICRSSEFLVWQERLAACFYDKGQKDSLVHEACEAVRGHAAGLLNEEVEYIQQTVIGHLVGLASQAATRPQQPYDVAVTARSSQEIEDLVIERFPYPIAVCYRNLIESEAGAGAFGCLLDTFESLIHYLTIIALSAYWRDGVFDTAHNRRLLEKFYKGKWGPGILMELLRETVRLYLKRADRLPYPQLVRYLFNSAGKPTASLAVLSSFIDLRNEVWGHKGGRADRFYSAILAKNRERLEEELNRLDWLTERGLWLPKEIDEAGLVKSADMLNGERRRKNRAVYLQLDPASLDINGGDILPERTLLLIDESTGDYLPLFPLSVFHFQQSGQGLFFLNDLDWAAKAERLKRARYLAYDLVATDERGNRYEARAGEVAANNLEAKVRSLAFAIQADGVPLDQIRQEVREVADYDLPEVWAEQASHLKTFAGREVWLGRLDEWVEAEGEGGYFLLLGTPGQGKSALLAQFASRRKARAGGCFLHMIKSHKNPRRFLQFVLWQVERFLDEGIGETSYQGDVDDLRNALVGALEKVVKKCGRAVVLIDALDELDHSGERINFLPEHLPAGVRIVVSCRPEIPLVNALRRRLREMTVEPLPPLAAEDLPLFFERYMETSLAEELRRAVDFDALFTHTDGNPLFLKRAMERILDEARREPGGSLIAIDISTFPNTVEAVFEDIYNEIAEKVDGRWTSEEGRAKARLIQLLSVAQEALSIDDLRGLLRADKPIERSSGQARSPGACSLEVVRDLVMQMSEYLLSYDGEWFLPFHQGFIDYLHRKLMGSGGVGEAHRVFCDWLSALPERRSLYRLRHLPAHLSECALHYAEGGMIEEAQRAFDELDELLTDYDFARAKVKTGMTFDFIRDYRAAFAAHEVIGKDPSIDLKVWSRFIEGESHILVDHPRLFFQQAINQPADSPVARSAEMRFRPPDSASSGEIFLRWLNKPAKTVLSQLRRTLIGHSSGVASVAILSDDKHAVSGGADHTLKLWDLVSGQCLATFEGHTGSITAVLASSDGKRVISGSWDNTLKVWDLASGQCIATLEGHTKPVSALLFTPDEKRIISAGDDLTIKVWDLLSSRCLVTLEGHQGPVNAVAITSDGRRLVSGSDDRELKVWDLTSERCIATLAGHTSYVTTLALTRDGRRVVSGGWDRRLRVWDMATGKCLVTLEGHTSSVSAVALTPDGKQVVSGSLDKTLKVWDLASGHCLTTLEGHTDTVKSVAVTSDGKQVVSGGYDRTLRIWDLDGPQPLPAGEDHMIVTAIALASDGKRALLGTSVGPIRVWDLEGWRRETSLIGHAEIVGAVAITPDERWALSGSYDQTLLMWDLASGQVVWTRAFDGRVGSVYAVAVTPDGKLAVSGGQDRILKVWDLESGQYISSLGAHEDNILAIAVTPDGKKVVSASWDHNLKVWDLITGECLLTLEGHEAGVNTVAMAPDGKQVVSGSWDHSLKVWDLASGRCTATFEGHKGWVYTVAFIPHQEMIASGSEDGALKVWDMATGECVATFPAAGAVRACAARRDGVIVCGDGSGRVYLLRLERREMG